METTLDQEEIAKIKNELEDIEKSKSDYDTFRDFIISCKRFKISIPDKIKSFIVKEIEK